MIQPAFDARALAQAGADALRRGDARAARESFERLIGTGAADAASFIGLAYACRDLNDPAGVVAALDRALELEPGNLGALILRGDHLTALGDARSASAFYRQALRLAPPPAEMPATLRDELARAKAMCDRFARA